MITKKCEYKITQKNGTIHQFEVRIDIIEGQEENALYPDWVRLEFNKCPNCPLEVTQCKYCPVAARIHKYADIFESNRSDERCVVEVTDDNRKYLKEADLQTALFSLFGFLIATSGCPVFQGLRPMALFHLPFSNPDETLFRVFSIHLLEQYIRKVNNLPFSFDFDKLADQFSEIETCNRALTNRVRNSRTGDAGQNAIVVLNSFGQLSHFEIIGKMDGLKKFFNL